MSDKYDERAEQIVGNAKLVPNDEPALIIDTDDLITTIAAALREAAQETSMTADEYRKDIAKAYIPEGHVMLSDGRVVKVLGTLPMTADGCWSDVLAELPKDKQPSIYAENESTIRCAAIDFVREWCRKQNYLLLINPMSNAILADDSGEGFLMGRGPDDAAAWWHAVRYCKEHQ